MSVATAKVIVVVQEGKSADICDVPIPKIRPAWVLVKTKAVGLNPTDWKHVDWSFASAGSRLGCDYAGIVEEVGADVVDVKQGDRVVGFCHGGHRSDHETGAFGEYVLAKACAQFRIPDHISFEQAAMMPVTVFTCALGLYKSLRLPIPGSPSKEPFPILINGGSTGTGMIAIQLAKLSGLTVIATASPRNFDYLKWLGADHVLDYRSPTCGRDINKLTDNKLQYAWDCAGGGEALCAAALSTFLPSKYGAINPVDVEALRANPLVEGPFNILAYDIFNERYEFHSKIIDPPVEDMEFAISFKEVFRDLLEKGFLKPVHISLNSHGNGLEGVVKGMDLMRQGLVSGCKMVYTL